MAKPARRSEPQYAHRAQKLDRALTAQKLDSILITHLPNIRYLCGFTGSNGVLVSIRGKRTFFTDGRYTEQAQHEVRGAKVLVPKGSLIAEAAKLLSASKLTRLGFEADRSTVTGHEGLRKALPKSLKLVATSQIVDRIRMVKDESELSLIRDAVILGADLLTPAVETIRPGIQESEVAAEMDYAARRWGAEAMSFETIVVVCVCFVLLFG